MGTGPYGQVLWTLRDPRHPRILGCGRLQRFAERPKLLSNFSFSGNFVPVGQFFFANPQIRLVSFLDLGNCPYGTTKMFRVYSCNICGFNKQKFLALLALVAPNPPDALVLSETNLTFPYTPDYAEEPGWRAYTVCGPSKCVLYRWC